MNAMQLEFQVSDESELEIKIKYMQKENQLLWESLRKVQKKLFAEVGELKKLCQEERHEKEKLKILIRGLLNEKTQWSYGEGNCLFHEK